MNLSDLEKIKDIKITSKDALIVIDIQNDFVPGGNLPVNKGDEIIYGVNKIIKLFKNKNARVVLTQDWHPPGHKSFASAHPGKKPFDEYSDEGIGPVLWPDHCVQGTDGANFHKDLETTKADAIIRKGTDPSIDSYSAFFDNKKQGKTGLGGYLKDLNIERIFLVGLALDYCVYFSAVDGKELGFDVFIIVDLTKGIDDPPGNISRVLEDMVQKGIKFTESEYIT